MRLIGAGFGRTGTFSLKTALEQLGFDPCYHMAEVFDKPRHNALWRMAAAGQPVDWDELFAGYQAAVDWPACAFYAQLMEYAPDAPVLLSVRDPEQWYTSVMNTIYQRTGPAPVEDEHGQMIRALIWENTFHGRFEDKPYAISIFERHIAEVKARVPAGRLLVYNVQEGWEPLCRFLGVPVPADTPFPRLNDTREFQARVRAGKQPVQPTKE
jgi:hypothetical protein